jgi:hypothetical protein
MANGGDKTHHDEKRMERKEPNKASKKGTVDRVKEQSTTKERTQ